MNIAPDARMMLTKRSGVCPTCKANYKAWDEVLFSYKSGICGCQKCKGIATR